MRYDDIQVSCVLRELENLRTSKKRSCENLRVNVWSGANGLLIRPTGQFPPRCEFWECLRDRALLGEGEIGAQIHWQRLCLVNQPMLCKFLLVG